MAHEKTAVPDDLLQLSQRLEAWRSANPPRTRLPEPSWEAAVELAQWCRDKLAADPFSGCVFVFRSRRATSIKVLVYDGMGFWLATKRLSKGRFRWWPEGETARKVQAYQAQLLFAAGNPDLAAAP